MKRLESFKEWLEQDESKFSRRGFLTGALAAGAAATLGSSSKGANTPVGSSDLVSPEDSIGMTPQIRPWESIGKSGHMENFDHNFVYIRFTDSPDVLSRVLRDSLSPKDKEYVKAHENFFRSNNRSRLNQSAQLKNTLQQQTGPVKPFDPKFGPKPRGIKNPTPMQVWKHQFNLIRKAEAEMAMGRRAPVDYVILYRHYNGQMPDPPEE